VGTKGFLLVGFEGIVHKPSATGYVPSIFCLAARACRLREASFFIAALLYLGSAILPLKAQRRRYLYRAKRGFLREGVSTPDPVFALRTDFFREAEGTVFLDKPGAPRDLLLFREVVVVFKTLWGFGKHFCRYL